MTTLSDTTPAALHARITRDQLDTLAERERITVRAGGRALVLCGERSGIKALLAIAADETVPLTATDAASGEDVELHVDCEPFTLPA